MKYQKQTLGGKITAIVLSAVLVLTGFVCGGFTLCRGGERYTCRGDGSLCGRGNNIGLSLEGRFNLLQLFQ